MQPTRETYPFDQECAVCHTPIPAGREHTHLSVGDHHPRTAELCDPCSRAVLPIWGAHGPKADAENGELSIAESLQLTAISLLGHGPRERHAARRLLNRYGWNRQAVRTLTRLRDRLRGRMDAYPVDAEPETAVDCLVCSTPATGLRGLIACHDGMAVVCRDCLDVLVAFADDGWMDEGEPPETGALMLWAQRFAPEQADLMPGKGVISRTGSLGDVMKESVEAARTVVRSRSRMLGMLENGRAVVVLRADGETHNGPLEHRNGAWWCAGTPVCDDAGRRSDDILAILPGVDWEDAD